MTQAAALPVLCAALALGVAAAPARAERVECRLSAACPDAAACAATGAAPLPVGFTIDRTQFSPPVDRNEPPRRQVTVVALGDRTLPAEPILIGDLRGFWAETGGVTHLLTVQPDGRGIYTRTPPGLMLTGYCGVYE